MADVLIIDHDERLVALLLAACRQAGMHADSAADGAEALSSLDWHPPRVILCATRLPDMHGWELCSVVRSDPKTTRLPFMLMFEPVEADRPELSGCGATLVSPRASIVQNGPQLLRILLGERRPTQRQEAPAPAAEPEFRLGGPAPATLRGTFSVLGLADLVQTIAGGGRPGRLMVTVQGSTGTLDFRDGQVIEAEFAGHAGEVAVRHLLEQSDSRQGSFVFLPGDQAGSTGSIRKSVQQLILAVATELDERRSHLIGDGRGPSSGT